jgi:hypothetical protein
MGLLGAAWAWMLGRAAVLIALLLAVLVLGLLLIVQTVRIDGVAVWPVNITGLRADLSAANATIKHQQDAQAVATAQWQAAVEHKEAASRMSAAVAETDHDQKLQQAYDAGRAYSAAHRVCGEEGVRAGQPPAGGADDAPAFRESLPAGGVVVSASDVQACSGATAYAIALHNWLVDQPDTQ